MFDAVMKRYGVRTHHELLTTWNRGQVLIALDALFWNSPKERDKYGRPAIDLKNAPAADIFGMMGFGGL